MLHGSIMLRSSLFNVFGESSLTSKEKIFLFFFLGLEEIVFNFIDVGNFSYVIQLQLHIFCCRPGLRKHC